MEEEARYTEAEFHKKMAVQLFNAAWTLIEQPDRTRVEDDRMVHLTHASRYHWEQVGTPKNLIIGEWQIAHVYTLLNRQEPALYHARRSLELCQEHSLQDFLIAYSYEAIAHALSLTQSEEAAQYLQRAYQASEQIANERDKKQLLNDLSTISTEGTT